MLICRSGLYARKYGVVNSNSTSSDAIGHAHWALKAWTVLALMSLFLNILWACFLECCMQHRCQPSSLDSTVFIITCFAESCRALLFYGSHCNSRERREASGDSARRQKAHNVKQWFPLTVWHSPNITQLTLLNAEELTFRWVERGYACWVVSARNE